MCRIVKAPQGSAIFDAVSEEQLTGRVVDRMVPPRGYTAVATSGLIAFEADEAKQQLPFGLADLQVWLGSEVSRRHSCVPVCVSKLVHVQISRIACVTLHSALHQQHGQSMESLSFCLCTTAFL